MVSYIFLYPSNVLKLIAIGLHNDTRSQMGFMDASRYYLLVVTQTSMSSDLSHYSVTIDPL
jgi:hypothetical protein